MLWLFCATVNTDKQAHKSICAANLPTMRPSVAAVFCADIAGKERFLPAGNRSITALAQTLKIVVQQALSACLRSEEHTSELQSRFDLVCRLLLEKKKK